MTPSDVTQLIPACCSEVLDSMYFTSVLDSVAGATLPPSEPGAQTFQLHFAGDLSGLFGLRVNAAASLSIAANFLGEEESALAPAEVADVIGELANMLCGSLVSHVPSQRKFILSHPEPVAHEPSAEGLHVVSLETDYGAIEAWILMDKASIAQPVLEEPSLA